MEKNCDFDAKMSMTTRTVDRWSNMKKSRLKNNVTVV